MCSSRSFNVRFLSLLKNNKEQNKVNYQESPPWLPTMFKHRGQPWRISGRTMDTGNHRLLLASSPAYYTFLKTPENYTLHIQRKNQVCLSHPWVSARPRVPESNVPDSNVSESNERLRVLRSHVPESPRPASYVSDSHVSESHVPEPHVPEFHVLSPTSQSPRTCPTFSHSPSKPVMQWTCSAHYFSFFLVI